MADDIKLGNFRWHRTAWGWRQEDGLGVCPPDTCKLLEEIVRLRDGIGSYATVADLTFGPDASLSAGELRELAAVLDLMPGEVTRAHVLIGGQWEVVVGVDEGGDMALLALAATEEADRG